MRVPIRNRGVAAGIVTLLLAPAIVLTTHLGGATGGTVAATRPTVTASEPSSFERVGFSSRFAPVHDVSVDSGELAPVPAKVLPPPPTPRPTPKPSASSVPPPVSYPPGSIQQIICDAATAHGVSCQWMLSIARCESGYNPHAYNPSGPYYGLFQFLQSTFRAHGGTDIWDPVQQSNITADMLAHGQAGQWTCA